MASESFDIIIAGGGLAGLVLASRISELPDVRVLVVEAGEDQNADPRVMMPAMWQSLIGTTATTNFMTVPQEGLEHRTLKSPQGRILGGSAALNGLAFAAPSKSNIEAWADLGNPGWEWSVFLESMRKAVTVNSSGRAALGDGPIQLTFPDDDTKWVEAWREVLAQHNFTMANTSDLFSGQICGGLITPDTVDPKTKQRSFPSIAYLRSVIQTRGNLTIWTQAVVNKILFRIDDATHETVAAGLEVTKSGQTFSVEAKKEIVLTAGTLGSPRLLELSGVGDASRLSSLGIDVVINNPFVGENLQNHPMCGINYEIVPKDGFETLDNLARQDPDSLKAALEEYSQQKGPLTKSNTNITAQLPLPSHADDELLASIGLDGEGTSDFAGAHGSYVRSVLSSRNEASATYILFPGFASSKSDGTMITAPSGTESYLSITLLLAQPLSRGSVHLTSTDGVALDPKYLTHALDIEVFARHLQFADKLISVGPLTDLIKSGSERKPGTIKPGDFEDLDRAKEYLRRNAIGAVHYTGTCSMMPREMGGVVDPQLRVYGCRNLRVCDASIIPIIPRANIQAAVYGVAEHAAGIIKGNL
ncbi:GMC oxidoreductase [Stachybotrys elegans]|uniref:GMC oxidoreductase n=1 Tax=Stachybotrys elegans TaxID=80388 RepID=A0A8K0SGD9_9HYPO|nr:GMC oxidoreductase [Stachybotrys elegans]